MAAIVEYLETAFTTGFQYRFPEVEREIMWREWYDGNIRSLLEIAEDEKGNMIGGTVDNGLALAPIINIPLFKRGSDFYAAAAMSELPAASSPDERIQAWLKENMGTLDRMLRRGTFYWSIADVGVFAAQPGKVEAVDPQFYFRVGTPDLPDSLVAHILAIRYVEKPPELQLLPEVDLVVNRCKVIRLVNGVATEQIYEMTPDVIGQPLTDEYPSPITAICVAGGWDSWYKGIGPVVKALLTQYSIHAVQLNRYANRTHYVPTEIYDQMRNDLTINRDSDKPIPPTVWQLTAEWNRLIRPTIGTSPDGAVPQESLYTEDFDSRAQFIEMLSDEVFLTAGLPPSAYGIGIGKGESGYARERAQDAASARIQAYRRDLAECLPRLCFAMGCPEGDLSFNWATPPFHNRESHTDEIVKLFDRGLITPQEARRSLGWDDSEELVSKLNQTKANDQGGTTND